MVTKERDPNLSMEPLKEFASNDLERLLEKQELQVEGKNQFVPDEVLQMAC